MKRALGVLTALVLLAPVGAYANIGTLVYCYAYPVPWSPAEGPLTLHYESGGSSPPTFIVVDTLGEEVISLVGARVNGGRSEGVFGDYDDVAVFEANWDGCNASGHPVNAGTYLCFVRSRIFRFIVVR
ncbi:MAG TPA: hypothetical protein VM054_09125 [bacterium]|nr:hypothetical protein [bacterium]